MSNDRNIEIGKDVRESINIAGDGNTATINIYHSQAKHTEISVKPDYDRLPIPSSDLIGRSKELDLLDNAFNDPKKYVVSIIAGGGVGKSALTYAWLDRIKPDYGGAKMIFGWSFYSQGSHDTQNSSAPFFQEAFRFFGYDKQMPKDEVEKGKELAKLLRNQPFVLILDGMEPLQHPVKILNGEIRDAALKEFLRCVRLYGLAEKSLVVISSRQPVVEYEQWKQGYEKIDLNVLNDVQGAALLENLGAKGPAEDLQNASRDMGGHALSLVLLGRLLAERFNGDVNRRDRLPNLFEDEKHGGHALRILQYYDREYWQEPEFLKRFWSRITGKIAPEQIFMRLLGLFDRPMGLKEKQVLCEKADFATPLAELNDNEFQVLEKRLENAGLLLKSDKSGIRTEWDCHPLIRNYFGKIFRKEEEKAFQQAHSVLFEYYQSVPEKPQPDTLEEMEPLYRAVVHGCLAGEYQKARKGVFRERIRRGDEHYSTKKLGSYAQDMTEISAFFPEGWEKPVSKGLSEANQAWLMAVASFCLMSLGRLTEAVEPRLACIKIAEKLEDWKIAATAVRNIVDLYLPIGSLKDAEYAAQQSITYADRTNNLFSQMTCSAKLATTSHRQGHLQKSLTHFQEAEKIQKERQPKYPRLYSIQGSYYCALLSDIATDTAAQEAVLDRGRYALEIVLNGSRYLLDIALNRLTIAHSLLLLNRLNEAGMEFDEAVKGIRKAGKIQHMPQFLLARAKFFRHQKQFPEAWHDLDEAKEIIERCGMKLYAVDAYLLEGNLLLDQTSPPAPLLRGEGSESSLSPFPLREGGRGVRSARANYEAAKELIGYTGYHLRDAELELLAARLAHFERDSEKTQSYLNKSYRYIEKIGYWGFLAEWERVRSESGCKDVGRIEG